MMKSASHNVIRGPKGPLAKPQGLFADQEAIKIIMRGQGKDMFGGYKPAEPHQSFYQGTFKGLATPMS